MTSNVGSPGTCEALAAKTGAGAGAAVGRSGAVPKAREGSGTGNASSRGAHLERAPRVPCPDPGRSPSPGTQLTRLSGAPQHSGASPGNCGLMGKQRDKKTPSELVPDQEVPGARLYWGPGCVPLQQTPSTCRPLPSLITDPPPPQRPLPSIDPDPLQPTDPSLFPGCIVLPPALP